VPVASLIQATPATMVFQWPGHYVGGRGPDLVIASRTAIGLRGRRSRDGLHDPVLAVELFHLPMLSADRAFLLAGRLPTMFAAHNDDLHAP